MKHADGKSPKKPFPSSSSSQQQVQAVIDAMVNADTFKTDPFGSYTGKPLNPREIPVQDADDL